jgi:hypothetical protein
MTTNAVFTRPLQMGFIGQFAQTMLVRSFASDLDRNHGFVADGSSLAQKAAFLYKCYPICIEITLFYTSPVCAMLVAVMATLAPPFQVTIAAKS